MDNIENIMKNIEYEKNKIESDMLLLLALVEFSDCDQKKKNDKLRKCYRAISASKQITMKIFHLKSLIKFIDKCNEEGIKFRLDKSSIDNTLHNKNLYDDYRKKLEFIIKNLGSYTNDRIKLICESIIENFEHIREYEIEIRIARKEKNKEDDNESYQAPTTTTYKSNDYHTKSSEKINSYSQQTEYTKNKPKTIETDKSTIISSKFDDISDYSYRHRIQQTFRKEHYNYFSDIVDATIDNYIISKKFGKIVLPNANFRFDPIDVLDFAINVFESLPIYLENKHMITKKETSEFFEKFNIEKCFDEYKKIYDKYMKAYSLLTSKNKEYHNELIHSYYKKAKYQSYFGKKAFSSPEECMVKPDDLRKIVNNKIINDVTNPSLMHLSRFFSSDEKDMLWGTAVLSNVTQYMDENEMARLYHAIKAKWSPYEDRTTVKFDAEIVEKSLRIFQNKFVELIVKKLYPKESYKLSYEDFQKLVQEKYTEICINILNEKPMTESKVL